MGWPPCPICHGWPGGDLDTDIVCKRCCAAIPDVEERKRILEGVYKVSAHAIRCHEWSSRTYGEINHLREALTKARKALALVDRNEVSADDWAEVIALCEEIDKVLKGKP